MMYFSFGVVICFIYVLFWDCCDAKRNKRRNTGSSSSSSESGARRDVLNLVSQHYRTNVELINSPVQKPTCAPVKHSTGKTSNCCVLQLKLDENSGPSSRVSANASIKCLPSFIVAGVQKGGTTVLSAFLSNHSQVYFAPRKETHYFDTSNIHEASVISSYFEHFSNWVVPVNISRDAQAVIARTPTAAILQSEDPPIFAESTPFYIHSRVACKLIAHYMPGAKLIILLRDPVQRAFSEYRMQVHRTEEVRERVALMKKHSTEVYRCLLDDDTLSWAEITACLPQEIAVHQQWTKMISLLRYLEGNFIGDPETHTIDKSNMKWQQAVHSCFFGRYTAEDEMKRKKKVIAANDCESGAVRVQPDGTQMCVPFGGNSTSTEVSNTSNRPPLFHPIHCYGKTVHYNPVQKVFRDEVQEFLQCLKKFAKTSSRDPFKSDQDLNLAIDACVKVEEGIETQYFYRSLYLPQLVNCFQYIPRKQILILPSEQLRDEPEKVLPKVLQFLDLDPMDTSTAGDSLTISSGPSFVKNRFPNFEREAGWQFSSSPNVTADVITEEDDLQGTEEFLTLSFRPFNQRLSKMLDLDLSKYWKI